MIHLDEIKGQNKNFANWKKQIARHKGISIDNDNSYDYRGYYHANTLDAWDLLNQDSKKHFRDKYKASIHPTFSNESYYSGRKHFLYNPNGIEGGTWHERPNNRWAYQLSKSQELNNWDVENTRQYLNENEETEVPIYSSDGLILLPPVTVSAKRNKPSLKNIKK